MIVPTRRFWALLAAGLLFPLGGMVVPGLHLALLPYDLLLFTALFLSSFFTPKASSFEVRRKHDQALSVRAANLIELTIINHGVVPASGEVAEFPPESMVASSTIFPLQLAGGRSKTFTYHLTPHTRGEDQFGHVMLRLRAPFGLGTVRMEIGGSEPVHVYPNVLALREFDLLRQRGKLSLMGIRKSRVKGQGTEFASLRDYRDDDFRRIDWKSTARRNRLVVKDYEVERNQSVIVAIDVGRHLLAEVDGISKLDHVLDASLMLLHAAASEGDQTGLLVFSDRAHQFLPPAKGRGQNGRIINALHRLYSAPVEPDYGVAFSYLSSVWKRRSLVVIFTDCEDRVQALRLSSALGSLTRRHLVFVVRVIDPKLGELQAIPIQSEQDLYQKGAALWYETERMQATTALKAAGVQTIEADPESLAQQLVSAYLVVKETAAL